MTIAEMVAQATELFGNVATAITGNAVLAAFAGISILGAGFGLFARAKKASK